MAWPQPRLHQNVRRREEDVGTPREKRVANAVPIFRQAVNEDPKLLIEAWANVTAALYTTRVAVVRLDTRLCNLSYFASGNGKRKVDMEGSRRMWVRKEGESLFCSFELMVFLWIYGLPWSL